MTNEEYSASGGGMLKMYGDDYYFEVNDDLDVWVFKMERNIDPPISPRRYYILNSDVSRIYLSKVEATKLMMWLQMVLREDDR